MKVICTRLPASGSGEVPESSPWVDVDGEYPVVSMLAEPNGRVQIQIVTSDGQSLAWFDSTDFMTVDSTIPDRWIARIGEGGALEVAPSAWLTTGFWEAYYDGDLAAAEAVESELIRLRDRGST